MLEFQLLFFLLCTFVTVFFVISIKIVVSEIGIPTYLKLNLHLSRLTIGSEGNTARQQIDFLIRNGES